MGDGVGNGTRMDATSGPWLLIGGQSLNLFQPRQFLTSWVQLKHTSFLFGRAAVWIPLCR